MNAVVNWLQNARWAIVGLHRIGKDHPATRLEDTEGLGQHTLAIAGMQNGILGPDEVIGFVLLGHVFKTAVTYSDPVGQTLLRRKAAVGQILDLADIQAIDRTTVNTRQMTCGAAIAGPEIENTMRGFDRPRHLRHAGHGAPAGLGDVIGTVVQADVNVFTAPDIEIEAIRIVAVVIALGDRGHLLLSVLATR